MSDTSQYTSTELQSAPQHTPSVRGVNFRARARRARIRECKEISGAAHAEPGNPWTRPGHGEFHGRVRDWKLLETRITCSMVCVKVMQDALPYPSYDLALASKAWIPRLLTANRFHGQMRQTAAWERLRFYDPSEIFRRGHTGDN
ncbi:hypothetical protein Bbelb_336840 [Branchiostoma belcheri]|nr:hypothetical protein Bbelb_336840 [Branchiostoma belcheri]